MIDGAVGILIGIVIGHYFPLLYTKGADWIETKFKK